MDPVANLERVLGDARALVDTVSTDDLAMQAPCTGWDVRALINHMIGVAANYGRMFGAGPAAVPGPVATAEEIAAAFREAGDALLAAIRAPSALDKTVKLSIGALPGRQALGIALADQMIHSWDLAKALGRPFTMDETLASTALRTMQELIGAIPAVRGEGSAFAAEISCPQGASTQDRLLAFSGRQP